MLGNAEARNSCYVYNLNWSDVFKEHNGNLSSMSVANTTEVVKCENFQHDQTFWKHTTIQVRNWNFYFLLKCRWENSYQAQPFPFHLGIHHEFLESF